MQLTCTCVSHGQVPCREVASTGREYRDLDIAGVKATCKGLARVGETRLGNGVVSRNAGEVKGDNGTLRSLNTIGSEDKSTRGGVGSRSNENLHVVEDERREGRMNTTTTHTVVS